MKGRIEQLTVFWAVALVAGLGAKVTKADLVAHWKLDEIAGTTATDSSGNGHDGILVGGLSFNSKSVKGVIDKALHLTGAEGASIHADSVSLPTSAFTVSLWFNPDSDQDSSGDKWYLMYWGGDEETSGNKPLYEFNEDEIGTIRLCIGIVGKEQYKLETKTHSWKAFTWYHLVATFDGTDVKLYVNGTLEDAANQPGTHYASSKVCFGSKYNGERPFKGRLDDIRIYSHALTADEITGLREYLALHNMLLSAVEEAEDIIQQNPKEAIVFLEKKITELEKWREKNPNTNQLYAKEISFDLYFELAKARKTAGLPEKDVDAARKRAFEEGAPSLSNCGSVLLWLFESGMTEEFEGVVHALIENNRDYLSNVGAEAEKMVLAGKPEPATRFLESNLAAYADWRQKHPNDEVVVKDSLPAIYFQLATMKEVAQSPKKDIADAYTKTFSPSRRNYVSKQTVALTWLLDKGFTGQCREIFKSPVQTRDVNEPLTSIVRALCQDYESSRNWPSFQLLLDSLFAEARYAYDWSIFVDSCLEQKTSPWADKYARYLDTKPRLKFTRERASAEKCAAEGQYEKAAQLYRACIPLCGPADDKAALEFEVCKCLFAAGEYREAIAEFERYVADNEAASPDQAKEAILMKAQACLWLGEFEKAVDSFAAFVKEFPAAKQVPKSIFLIGYCQMRQGNLEKATEALDLVVRDFPESSYANRARLCLGRIKNPARQEESRR